MTKLPKTKVLVDGREIEVFSNIVELFKQSKRTREQSKTELIKLPNNEYLEINIRFDDQCGNKRNTFAITGTVYDGNPTDKSDLWCDRHYITGGCIHDIIAKYAPKYAKYIKWHLTYTDGPTYYIENTSFFVKQYLDFDYMDLKYRQFDTKEEYLEAARECAVWPDATIEQLGSELALHNRLPALMQEFKADMEELGFTW